jgi:hypothetical protein
MSTELPIHCGTDLSAWHPIETAPVAKAILAVWRPVDHEARPFHKEIVVGSRCHDTRTGQPDGRFYSGGMWYDERLHITHWMPLPAPPRSAIMTA